MIERTVEEVMKEIDPQVELGICYEEIKGILQKYMEMNEEYYKLIPIWVIGTYFFNNFDAYPFLYINAQKGSGKTRLLKIISHLAFKGYGQVQTGITESVLFRMEQGQAMLLDECEAIASKDKATLREYLNASYKRGGIVKRNKKVKTKEGEDYQLQSFEVFRPVVMANIYGMNDILGDRCITLILEKNNNSAKTKLLEQFYNNQEFFNITKKLYNLIQCSLCSVVTLENIVKGWNKYIIDKYSINYIHTHTTITTLNNITTLDKEKSIDNIKLNEIFNKIDEANMSGRNLELAMPLIAVSSMLGEEIFTETLRILKTIMENKQDDEFAEDRDTNLIEFVATKGNRFDYILINELTRQFRDYLGEIDNEETWLNAKWVGRGLKRLNLTTSKKRVARGIEVVLAVDRAKEKIKMFKTKEVENAN